VDLTEVDKILAYASKQEMAEYITAYSTLAIALMLRDMVGDK
jgi:hypothetical protein